MFLLFALNDCAGICGVLNEKSKCPKCSSDKFKAEDLLPNVSLRLAIMQLLESQIQCSISETALRRYAPGRELITSEFLIFLHPLSWQRDDGGSYSQLVHNLLSGFNTNKCR